MLSTVNFQAVWQKKEGLYFERDMEREEQEVHSKKTW